MRTILATVFAAALGAGGRGTTSGTVEYSGGVAVDTPDLVYVSPGVSVIADYDEPIFYSDGYYWRQNSGVWYRSGYYTGGWVSASAPYAVVSIGNPYGYVHYRPNGYAARGSYYGGNRGGYYGGNRGGYYGCTRDHRTFSPPPRGNATYRGGGSVRGGGGFRGGGGVRGGGGGMSRDHRR